MNYYAILITKQVPQVIAHASSADELAVKVQAHLRCKFTDVELNAVLRAARMARAGPPCSAGLPTFHGTKLFIQAEGAYDRY